MERSILFIVVEAQKDKDMKISYLLNVGMNLRQKIKCKAVVFSDGRNMSGNDDPSINLRSNFVHLPYKRAFDRRLIEGSSKIENGAGRRRQGEDEIGVNSVVIQ